MMNARRVRRGSLCSLCSCFWNTADTAKHGGHGK